MRSLLLPIPLLLASCSAETQDWKPAGRLETTHLHLLTARSPEATRRIADLLERGLETYRGLYGKAFALSAQPPRLTLYLFADREAFARAASQEAPELDLKGVTGFYSYASRALYVGGHAGQNEEAVSAVALHELTHALDHQWARVVPDGGPDGLPPWLLEGRADHLAYAILPSSSNRGRPLHRALQEQDLDRLTRLDGKDFLKEAYINYALSWAFVKFLMEGEHAPAFRSFLKGMPAHCGKAELEKALGPIPALEAPFREYAEEAVRGGNPRHRQP